MRVRVNTPLVSCILLTIATAMLLPSSGINYLINKRNDGIAQSAGYGELTMLLILIFVTWTGLIKSDWKAWVTILAMALLWEYPVLARLYVKHYGLSLPLGVVRELAFIGTDSRSYIQVLLGIYGCFLTFAALTLSAISVFSGKGKEVKVGRGFVLSSVSILLVLLFVGVWVRLREGSIPQQELNTFIVAPPAPETVQLMTTPMPGPLRQPKANLPICDPSVCTCEK